MHPPGLIRWIQRQPFLAFLIFSFLFSWLIWLIPYWIGISDPAAFRHLVSVGAFGPALAGLLVASVVRPLPQPISLQARIEQFVQAFIAVAAIYFICLPYASTTLFNVSPFAWVMRVLLFAAAALVVAPILNSTSPLRRLILKPSGVRTHFTWYIVAILIYPLVLLAGLGLSIGFGQALTSTFPSGVWEIFLLRIAATLVYVFFFGGPLNEEPGWRGFALPHLQQKISSLLASLSIGLLWGVWHFPMHINGFYPSAGPESLPQELALRVVSTLLVSFLYTWFYNKTGGNVLVCMLLHASFNTASIFIAGTTYTLALMAAIALLLAVESKMWKRLAPSLAD